MTGQKRMVVRLSIEWKRRLTILGIAAGTIAVYRYLLPIILPFLAAWILAAWLHPVAVRLQARTKIKKSVWGAALLTVAAAVAVLVLYWVSGEILGQLKTAVARFPALLKWASVFLDECCEMLEEMTGIYSGDLRVHILENMEGMQEEFMAAISPQTFTRLFGAVKNFLLLCSGAVVTFISAILILADMDSFQRKIWDYTWLVGIRRVINQLKKTTAVYMKAQVIIIFIVAAVCAAGFWVMKSPYFLILGIALGLLDALPIIGTGTFLYPAALVFAVKGNFKMAAGCVLLDIVTSILREYLEPKLLGGRLGISPIAVLGSVYIGLFLFGTWGVLLGPLCFSTIYETGRVWDVWD